jgi:UMF1 family MFS transporter
MGLYWFNLENIYIGLTFYSFFWSGIGKPLYFIILDLPDIAYPEQQDSISAKGYSFGYIGK